MTESKPSKSARKRENQSLQELGEHLLDLDADLLESLSLDERLHDAIQSAGRMKSHEALRRQKQYIGKLMRGVDVTPIRALLDRLRADDRRLKRVFANAERWRDRLVREGLDALPAFEEAIDGKLPAIAQQLSDLSTAVSDRREKTIQRQIFRLVHEALAARSPDG